MFIRIILIWSFIQGNAYGQRKKEKELMDEGNKLYKSEMASWYGTDVFVERLPNKRVMAGGYFSYLNGNKATCIFFSRDETPRVLATISFDSTYSASAAAFDSTSRDLTPLESDLHSIRQTALSEVRSDTLFKNYKNTSLNLIPISDELGKRVYILTGPQKSGVVIFGNDYLIAFSRKGKLVSKSKLHKGLIPIEYIAKDGQVPLSSIHSHLPEYSEYMTATDICTLRLYAKTAKWNQHLVMSADFVSLWDCNAERLVILTRKAWEKMSGKNKYLPK